jgi:hypothetical protein
MSGASWSSWPRGTKVSVSVGLVLAVVLVAFLNYG